VNTNKVNSLHADSDNISRRQRLLLAIVTCLIENPFIGSSKLIRNAYKIFGRLPDRNITIRTKMGFQIEVNPGRNKGVDALLFTNRIYEAGTLHVMKSVLRPGDTFIDAGANIGLMSLAGAQWVGHEGRVHAFEPVPDIYRHLLHNILINHAENIVAHNCALGERQEQRTIYQQLMVNYGSATLQKPENYSESHVVNIETLDHFIDTQDIKTVRMLKADVEGWELELLKGSTSLLSGKNAPVLCLEYSRNRLSEKNGREDVYQFVKRVNDYKIFKLKYGKETLSPLVEVRQASELPVHDNIFCFLPDYLEMPNLKQLFGAMPLA
jgi:FkbM family methyltransferase